MSVREFFAAIPKVDLNLQLTGALRMESLVMIARQNGIPNESEDYEEWLGLLDAPDFARIDEIARVAGSWIRYPEDIALVVYDMGVALSKQNVRYAEICITPSDFIGSTNMNVDVFIEALNDGRDRALRAWKVDMSWIMCIPRDNPRVGDDVARWATGASARRGNVVALGLTGQEDAQPLGQFKRAFATAQKKDIFTVANAGSSLGASGIEEALSEIHPHRLTDAWGNESDASTLDLLAASGIPVVVSLTRALRLGIVKQPANYPLKQLMDNGVQVSLSAGMPTLYQSSLIDEYVMAHEDCGIEIDQLIGMARRSIELSFMSAEGKQAMLHNFDIEVKAARALLNGPA